MGEQPLLCPWCLCACSLMGIIEALYPAGVPAELKAQGSASFTVLVELVDGAETRTDARADASVNGSRRANGPVLLAPGRVCVQGCRWG